VNSTTTKPAWARDARAVPFGIVVSAFLFLATSHIPAGPHDHHLDALGYALLAVAGMSLAITRRWPWVAVAAITVVLGLYLLRHYPGGPVFVTGWIALFSLGYRVPRRHAFIGAALLSATLIVTAAIAGRSAPLLHLVFVGWSAAAVFLGDALRNRRDYLAGLEVRAHELERTREEEARRRVAEERLRIAQDLHDSVAHAMATINVQAGAAAHVVDRRPEAAKDALVAIQQASAEVLDELAALLNLLRDPTDRESRAPTPGLEQLDDLVASTRRAALPVALTTDGPLDVVPRPVGTAAYRIVQESLTNIVRHAHATAATVRVRATATGALDVEVVDDGRADGAALAGNDSGTGSAGHGIQGMRERAVATGGAVDVGPREGGGFRVHASWPAS